MLGKLTRDISSLKQVVTRIKCHRYTYENAVTKHHRCRRLAPRNTMFRNKCISVLISWERTMERMSSEIVRVLLLVAIVNIFGEDNQKNHSIFLRIILKVSFSRIEFRILMYWSCTPVYYSLVFESKRDSRIKHEAWKVRIHNFHICTHAFNVKLFIYIRC